MDKDIEKTSNVKQPSITQTSFVDEQDCAQSLTFFSNLVSSKKVEQRGIVPVPEEERNNRRTYSIVCPIAPAPIIGQPAEEAQFTLWFTLSTNLLPIVTGMAATISYGLDLLTASLVILSFSALCTIPPAYLATIGPKTGMRQMVQARYSFGFYLVSVPVILNLATLTGFCIIQCVVGGQTLSAVTEGHLTPNIGIVIVALVGMVVCFFGFKALHLYDWFAWIPTLIAIVVAVGCSGKHLHEQVSVPNTDPQTVLSFAALVAGFTIPWAGSSSDYVTYTDRSTPKWKIFGYTYGGLFLPTVPLMILGAAIGGAVPNVPSWSAGYESRSVGGVFAAMLEPAGGFGKFLVVLLALSILGNLAATMYSMTLNFQLLVPCLARVPRFLYSILITAIVIPVSIFAARDFFLSLENFIGIIGYWAASFAAIVIIEHAWFRRSDYSTYDHASWNVPGRLPTGLAAIGAGTLSFALVIPSMAQVWYTGPIAKYTGDIGFEMAFTVTLLLYLPLRTLEIRLLGRR